MLAPGLCRPIEAWSHTGCQRLAPHWLSVERLAAPHELKTGATLVSRGFSATAGATQGAPAPLAPTCALDQLDLFEQVPFENRFFEDFWLSASTTH